jgi:hypothetical protein
MFRRFPDFAKRNAIRTGPRQASDRLAQLAAAVDLSFEPNTLRQHQVFGAARCLADVEVNLNGKFR